MQVWYGVHLEWLDCREGAKMNKWCKRCGGKLEYQAIPIYGDYNLGIGAEFYRCCECRATYTLAEVRYDKVQGVQKEYESG